MCTGLAQYFGWPVLVVRIVFVGLALAQLFGVLAYGALWLLMPRGQRGRRPRVWRPRRAAVCVRTGSRGDVPSTGAPSSRWPRWAPGCSGWCRRAGSGCRSGCSGRWPSPASAPPWCGGRPTRRAQQRWRAEAGGRAWLAPFVARGGWPALVRVIVGLGLVGAAFGLVVAQYNQLAQLPQVLAMTLLALAGLAVVLAPWLHRSRTALNEARAEKVRADERADMAAHLHDSVLQTLALIQRQADDPRGRARLARGQERELRALALRRADAADETPRAAALHRGGRRGRGRLRGVPVEVVWSGDCADSTTRCRPWSGPPARRWSTRPSTRARTRSTCTSRSTDDRGRGVRPRPRRRLRPRRRARRPARASRGIIRTGWTRHGGTATIRIAARATAPRYDWRSRR